jgi:two-component system, OmpR family, phosphate regulon sensor histidine kinase PhoR
VPEAAIVGRSGRARWFLVGAGGCAIAAAGLASAQGRFAIGYLGVALVVALTLLAALTATASWLAERRRIRALHDWVAGPMRDPPPATSGPIGDLTARVAKTLRERERAIEVERERLSQFLAAIEAAPSGVLLLDAEDQLRWFNATAASHFGLDPTRDLLQRLTNIVRAPAFVAHLQSHRYDTDVVFRSPQGNATVSVLVRPYGDSMRVALSQDITERERNDAMRRDFVANVSHEIRSPLTVLSGFIESLADLPLSGAERERVLLLMRQQSQRMQALVTDLLALARIEGAPRPPTDRWVDADAMLRQIESDAVAIDAERHRLHFGNHGVARLAGVESEIFSACWNLVSNALRYTPAGGRVEVAWAVAPNGSAEFCVSDDGPGIAREHIPRITERFYRVDPSRSRETGGTGLGLAIVKHVAQRHGGELLITSEVGKGSQFRLQLPPQRMQVVQPAVA